MYIGLINFLLNHKVLVLGLLITYLSTPVIGKVARGKNKDKLTLKDGLKLAVSFACVFMI